MARNSFQLDTSSDFNALIATVKVKAGFGIKHYISCELQKILFVRTRYGESLSLFFSFSFALTFLTGGFVPEDPDSDKLNEGIFATFGGTVAF